MAAHTASLPILAELPALPSPTVQGIFKSLSHKRDLTTTYTRGPVVKTDVKPRFAPNLNEPTQRFLAVRPSASSPPVSDSSGIESDLEEAWEVAFQDMDKEFPAPTYELLGKTVKQEGAYLSEAGPEVYTKLCLLLCSPYTDIRLVTEEHVLYQCQYVLLGIPTSLFRYDPVKVEFVPEQSVCCTGISPDSLVDALYSIAYSGTLYLRLQVFCEKYGMVERFGNIVKGLVGSVQQYLYLYQMFLNQLKVSSLLQLLWKIKNLTSQLEFLCNLLLLDEGLPTGVELLNYIYRMAEILTFSPHYKVLLAVLRGALTPYIKFLELWLCEGKVWDDWDEYHIVPNQEWVNNQDYLFWQYGYTWREGVPLPIFLTDMYEQLLNTGRLVNLFRQCVPNHPLSVSRIVTPKVNISFSDNSISRNLVKWERYKHTIESELNTQTVIRKMERQEEAERRTAQIKAAREDSRRRIALIMEEAGMLQNKAAENKKELLHNLQVQMLERAEQRADQIEAERREDRERIELNNKEQYELVAQVREQLEEYYATLNEEVARKERRTLWRVHRMKLNRLRKAYLTLEQHNLNNEYRSFVQGGCPLAGSSVEKAPPRPSDIGIVAAENARTDTRATDTTPVNERTTTSPPVDDLTPSNAPQQITPETPAPPSVQTADNTETAGAGGTAEIVPSDSGQTAEIVPDPGQTAEIVPLDPAETAVNDDDQEPNDGDLEGAKCEHQTSDDDSEISFELPSDNKIAKPVLPTEETTKSGDTDTTSTPVTTVTDTVTMATDTRISEPTHEPAGQAKNLIYPPDHATENVPTNVIRAYEPSGQMEDILYGDNTDAETVQTTPTEQPSEGQDMKNLLYSKEHTAKEHKVIQYEPSGQMEDILYGDNTDAETAQTTPTEQPSEGQDMKNLLYSKEHTAKEHKVIQYEPSGQMEDILYGAGCNIAVPSDQKPSIGGLNESMGEMKDILYGNNDAQKQVPVIGNLYESGEQMQDLLYGDSSKNDARTDGIPKTSVRVITQPESEMKELLYGDCAAPTETPTQPASRGIKEPEGKMWELLYGSANTGLAKPADRDTAIDTEIPAQSLTNSSVGEDSGYVDYSEPLRLSYPELDTAPNPYIMTDRLTKYCVVEDHDTSNGDVESCRSLEITLKRMIEQPLVLQMKLVNNAALLYFFDHLKVNDHFDALRSYICMNNGMFGDTLAKALFNMIESGVDITDSPALLNSALHSAMEASSKIEERLSLETASYYSDSVLDCLVLKYDVDWPCNIIITDETMFKYNEIFRFLMKLKHSCFTLDKIWYHLSTVHKKSTSPQIRKLQICRNEVSQCLHTVQIYMTHQLHNISWHELQTSLSTVDSLSELQALHERYLDQALERLLLGEQTKAPLDILLKIFVHIRTFSKLLESEKFTPDVNGDLTHPHFNMLISQHRDFEKQASFILKIAESSNSVGYKPYIDEFILRLDFNHYYQSKSMAKKRHSLAGLSRRVSTDKLKVSSVFSSPSTVAPF